ncbi:MAG: hypothetical protein HEQ25_10405 [Dolichospermum sp. DET73]|uniref:hypothetical protein n=1 Tax=Anabaena sp. 90 TaxID=46234 RepID=UPI00130D5203|nr:hypothetical protein [Anabaena sp. 90]MBO1052384.1 hypothetical protein [Dolichospermum sp. DET73]
MLGLFPYFSRTGQQTAVSRSQESGVRSQESGGRRRKKEEEGVTVLVREEANHPAVIKL